MDGSLLDPTLEASPFLLQINGNYPIYSLTLYNQWPKLVHMLPIQRIRTIFQSFSLQMYEDC